MKMILALLALPLLAGCSDALGRYRAAIEATAEIAPDLTPAVARVRLECDGPEPERFAAREALALALGEINAPAPAEQAAAAEVFLCGPRAPEPVE